jgi:hypothetical protein
MHGVRLELNQFIKLTHVDTERFDDLDIVRLPEKVAGVLAPDLCFAIAAALAKKYLPNANDSTIHELATRSCSELAFPSSEKKDAAAERWRDYLLGASLVINPLPQEVRATFYLSDSDALRSDWITVWSRTRDVWIAASNIRDWLFQSRGKVALHDEPSQRRDSPFRRTEQ